MRNNRPKCALLAYAYLNDCLVGLPIEPMFFDEAWRFTTEGTMGTLS